MTISKALLVSGLVEAEGIVAFRNITVNDIQTPTVIPALSRVTIPGSFADINASAILSNSWSAGYIRLYLNGVIADGFPPLSTPTTTTSSQLSPAEQAAKTSVSSGFVEAEGIVPFRNIAADDLPRKIIIPALSRVTVSDGNSIADINASVILVNSWKAGYIRLFVDGHQVDTFPPLQIDVVEAEVVSGSVGLVVDDMPTVINLPVLTRTALTAGANTVADVNASAELIADWNAGKIRLYLNGVKVTSFPPLSTTPIAVVTPVVPPTPPTPPGPPSPGNAWIGFEQLVGVTDGVNKVFTLARMPVTGSVRIFNNGLALGFGASNDAHISGKTVTFTTGSIPQPGDFVTASYQPA